MPRLEPPPGTITRQQAVRILISEKVITSASMLTKLKGIKHITPDGRTHGFYSADDILRIINNRRTLYNLPLLTSLFSENHHIVFRQAKPEDMKGVYEVAHKLFGHTTSAEDRIPLVQKCPEGNVVVTDNGVIVSYAHLQPLKAGPLKRFLKGEIRGSQITADDLDPFESGQVTDILVKSLGSYHEHIPIRKRYSKALFVGLHHELIRWGQKGYIIHRVYATSETESGIEAAIEFQMHSLGKIPGTKGKKRFAFELDPYTSQYPMVESYGKALAQWKEQHPQEYEEAWRTWYKRHEENK